MYTMGHWKLDVQQQCLLQKDELDGFGEVFTDLVSLVGRLMIFIHVGLLVEVKTRLIWVGD